MKKYLRKNVPFDPENEQERGLYEWLQTLGHGEFAAKTKSYWMDQMRLRQVQTTASLSKMSPKARARFEELALQAIKEFDEEEER